MPLVKDLEGCLAHRKHSLYYLIVTHTCYIEPSPVTLVTFKMAGKQVIKIAFAGQKGVLEATERKGVKTALGLTS